MAVDARFGFNRPITLALAALAIVGWLVADYCRWQTSNVRAETADALQRAEIARQGVAADLQNLEKAAGTAADLKRQADEARNALAAAVAARGAAQKDLAELTKGIDEARLAASAAREEASAKARELGDLQAELKAASDELAILQGQISALAARQTQAQADLAAAQNRAEAASEEAVAKARDGHATPAEPTASAAAASASTTSSGRGAPNGDGAGKPAESPATASGQAPAAPPSEGSSPAPQGVAEAAPPLRQTGEAPGPPVESPAPAPTSPVQPSAEPVEESLAKLEAPPARPPAEPEAEPVAEAPAKAQAPSVQAPSEPATTPLAESAERIEAAPPAGPAKPEAAPIPQGLAKPETPAQSGANPAEVPAQPEAVAPAAPAPNPPPAKTDPDKKIAALEPAERAANLLRGFDGGPCFLVRARGDRGNSFVIDGVGGDKETFQRFYASFIRDVGVEPTLTVTLVAPPQCPAVDLIAAARENRAAAPTIELAAYGVARGKPLAGTIGALAGRNLDLLLISNDGFAYEIDHRGAASDANEKFSVPITPDANSMGAVQVLLAIASPKPLEALAAFRAGAAAELLPKIAAQIASSDAGLEAAYFRFLK